MVKVRQLPTRQRFRKGLRLLSLLLFPATLYYFSPVLILQGAAEGIVNGSLIVFTLMFLSALFVGRLWCGWACPAGALQEFGQPVNDERTPGGKFDWIKWIIWIPWIGLIIALAVSAGGFHSVDPLYQLETGVTMALPLGGGGPPWFVVYYVIIALSPSLAGGPRFGGWKGMKGRRRGGHRRCRSSLPSGQDSLSQRPGT